MAGWNLGDAEMAIALKRIEINRALAYRPDYHAEDHNLCLALVEYEGGATDVLAAYSNDSAIPESIRLGLNLAPNLYGEMPEGRRFGCDGMGQYHTEPKLLNYLCATVPVRQGAIGGPLPKHQFYRFVLEKQRQEAQHRAGLMRGAEQLSSVMLVSEIACCPTCTDYSISRFRATFPLVPLQILELGKKVSEGTPASYRKLKILTG